VHSITALSFLCSAGAFHRRAMIFSFGRRISSPRRILFRSPAHSPPIHRFCVAVRPAHLIAVPHSLTFAGAFAANPPILVLLFGRRISSPCRILFCLPAHLPPTHRFWCCCSAAHLIAVPHSLSFAGAFAANPPIWCCSVWPAHSPPIHQFGVAPFGRRIPRRAATDLALFHLAGAFPADSVSSFADHELICKHQHSPLNF